MKQTEIEVKDLIVPAEEMVRPQNPAKRRKKAKRAACVERADYQVLTENNCDLIVEKYKTGELVGKLILSPGRNEFCFRNAKDRRLVLNHVNVSRFFKEAWVEGGTGLVSIPEEILWMEDISPSCCYDNLYERQRIFQDPVFVEMAGKGAFYYSDVPTDGLTGMLPPVFKKAYGEIRNVKVFEDLWEDDAPFQSVRPMQEESAATNPFETISTGALVEHAMQERMLELWGPEAETSISLNELWKRFYLASPDFYLWLVEELAEQKGISKKELFRDYLLASDSRGPALVASYYSFVLIGGVFGLEWAKKAVKSFLDCGVESVVPFHRLYRILFGNQKEYMYYTKLENYGKLSPVCQFEPEAFLQFLIPEAGKEGFLEHMDQYLKLWEQTLFLQELVYGQITEPYPVQLASAEYRMFSRVKGKKEEIYTRIWRQMTSRMDGLSYRAKGYSMVMPKSVQEVYADWAAWMEESFREIDELRDFLDGSMMAMEMKYKREKKYSIFVCPKKKNVYIRSQVAWKEGDLSIADLNFLTGWMQKKGMGSFQMVKLKPGPFNDRTKLLA